MRVTQNNFFELSATDGAARAGVMHTAHGDILTPAFMPVGTQATVKALTVPHLHDAHAQIILGNTYHLHLRPGEDVVAALGGLHKFMSWDGPMLTDSGGFQVFSLATSKKKITQTETLITADAFSGTIPQVHRHNNGTDGRGTVTEEASAVKIDADGVTFKSYIDGSTHRFTPESAIEIQKKLGADIMMAFDICTPDAASHADARAAMNTTHEWALRCLAAHVTAHGKNSTQKNGSQNSPHAWTQFLFGIIQGAQHRDLREESAQFISAAQYNGAQFDGIAIGGESIGYNMEATATTLEWLAPLLPANRPRYTMGVGYKPRDLVAVTARGADMFDCVAPTRIARNGTLYTRATPEQVLNIRNSAFRTDPAPIDAWCDCFTCTHHTRAYVHHLFRCDELLGLTLASIHNVRFMLKVCEEMRAAICGGTFSRFAAEWK